ncbi:hypothetical protein [Pseudoxanthomonas sp. JBR18]|nr:hypothetical protein [Pseudoxanthomonas sp. JBR18]WCE03881.1 hypothetical protein PJ250_17615 [Pseudoxanthomonas sp. JBR18]
MSAAIGIAVGLDQYILAAGVTLLCVFVMGLLGWLVGVEN